MNEHRRHNDIDHGAENRAMLDVIDDHQKTVLLDTACTIALVAALFGLFVQICR